MFFETIKINNGKAFHLTWHQNRLNATQAATYCSYEPIILKKIIPPKKGLWRCKVVYNETIQKIEYYPYHPRAIKKFKLIQSQIDYSYKFLNRFAIDKLFSQRGEADDIIIVKDSLLTDTSIANIALFYKGEWLTPKTPLLAGTTRARLLAQKKLIKSDILAKDIKKFEKIAIMNAMIDFYVVGEIDVI